MSADIYVMMTLITYLLTHKSKYHFLQVNELVYDNFQHGNHSEPCS